VRIIGAFRLGLVGGLGVLAAVLIGTALGQLSTILTYVGIALFLALGLDPVVRFLEARSVPRGPAVAIVMVAVLAAFVGAVFAIVPTIVTQTTDLVENLTTYLQSVTAQQFVDNLQSLVPENVFDVQNALDTVVSFLTDPKNVVTIGGGVLAVGLAITSGLAGTLAVLILTLYFMASLTSIKRGLARLVPLSSRSEFTRIADEVSSSVGRYVIGQVALALVNGVLSFVVMSILGAQLPAFFAFLAFLGALIPLVGTVGAAAVIVLAQVALLPLSPATWISLAVWYVVYMQVEAYVLAPRVMRQAVKIPGVVVIIAALVGGTLLGVLGALVAVPVAAAVVLVVREVVVPRQNRR
jgi:predicted PurR-regulated permease PerM